MGAGVEYHMASHYATLAIQYATKPTEGAPQNHVSIVAPPTECSQTINLPSARISNKGGATMRPKGSVHHMKVDPGSADPPGPWKTGMGTFRTNLENSHQARSQESSQHRWKINRSVARILVLFHWYSFTRMLSIIGRSIIELDW